MEEESRFENDWKILMSNTTLVIKSDITKDFLRETKLLPTDINPLLIIRQPRELKKVMELYDKLPVDKLIVKNFNAGESLDVSRLWVSEHPEYTHIIVTSDDLYVSKKVFDQLIDDVLTYDFPAIAACCNMCHIYSGGGSNGSVTKCLHCFEGKKHPRLDIIRNPISYTDANGRRRQDLYLGNPLNENLFMKLTDRKKETIIQCFFQGHAMCVIRRDIWDRFGFKAYDSEANSFSTDIAFACDLYENNIPQFVDLRAYCYHDSRYHKYIKIGKDAPSLTFCSKDGSKKIVGGSILGMRGIVYAPLLVCTPFNNESQSIDLYVQSLLNIDYPKEFIDLVWLENDSVDDTWKQLKKWEKIIREKYNYRSFTVIQKDYGLKDMGKTTLADFLSCQAGKNKISSDKDRIRRGKRLCEIYHYFFDQVDQSKHKYIVFLFADVICPQNVLKRYIQVFNEYPDAGWVGGVHHKRFPLHMRPTPESPEYTWGLAGPLRRIDRPPYVAYASDAWVLQKQMRGHLVFEVGMTGHVWMMKPEIYFSGGRMEIDNVEIVFPIIKKIWSMGLKVYCASDIYLKHVSLDGKVYRNNLYEELEHFNRIFAERKKLLEPMPPRVEPFKEVNVKEEVIVELMPEKKEETKEEIEISEKQSGIDTQREILRNEYENFKKRRGIPLRRPANPERCIMDQISHQIINQKQWDELYGKWFDLIEEDYMNRNV